MYTKPETLVIISYYDRRPIDNLNALLNSMQKYDSGSDYSICIVVNRTSDKKINVTSDSNNLSILYRNNTGMNIGAWDHGWRTNQDYNDYLFLQDECYINRNGWISSYQDATKDSAIGLIGESINENWDHTWDSLHKKQQGIKLPEHELNGNQANRVDVYLKFMNDHNIPSGTTGRHLRSLIWYAKSHVLRTIDGFPIGSNYGECIASEISVSKKIESKGFVVTQVNKNPFYFIRHLEWNKDNVDSGYTHKPILIAQKNALKIENNNLKNLINASSWTFIMKLVKNKLKHDFKNIIRRMGI